jgi:hypothetical protein
MISDPVRRVITLLGAIAADGGDAVVNALRVELGQLAPFDEGELLLTLGADVHRRSLTQHNEPLAGDDILATLGQHHDLLRIDDERHSSGHPRTRERLARRQLRSLIAVPIVFGDATRGAIALAAHRPCAFAGAPVQALLPLASAAGLALLQALKLSGLNDEQEHVRHELRQLAATLAERERSLLELRCQSEAREAEREATLRALEDLRQGHAALLHAQQPDRPALGQQLEHARLALAELRARLVIAERERDDARAQHRRRGGTRTLAQPIAVTSAAETPAPSSRTAAQALRPSGEAASDNTAAHTNGSTPSSPGNVPCTSSVSGRRRPH